MKKVLVIDDSTLMRRVLSDIIESTKEYYVAYTAKNGVEGLECIENNQDIAAVLCDVNMPRMSGLELLQVLRKKNIDIPIILISSNNDTQNTISALQMGAIDFIKKPHRILTDAKGEFEKRVIDTLKLCSEYKNDFCKNMEISKQKKASSTKKDVSDKTASKLIAIVCSTGGPKALQSVLPRIPANIDAPILLVQHMPAGFTNTLAERLNELSSIMVKEAENGEVLKKGVCYLAKGGTHLGVKDNQKDASICFIDEPAIMGLKPCGNIMYESLCDSSFDEIICVVLTGMGEDGTKGIIKLSKCKDIFVIAQDAESSTVYGMPRAVYERGLTDCVCNIDKIADEITKKVGVK